MSKTRAALNRSLRQEALREQLANSQHVIHIIELLDKIQDPANAQAEAMLARWKVVIDTKLKLLNKYLPDLKAVEMEHGGTIEHTHGDLSVSAADRLLAEFAAQHKARAKQAPVSH